MPPHCDSLDGPVVIAAKDALAVGDVNQVLPFVPSWADDEVIRAFERAKVVAGSGVEARELAEQWFFETVVRLHRMGEGAGFEGLKPLGINYGPSVALAERAIATGDADPLLHAFSQHLRKTLKEKLEELELATPKEGDLEAARAYTSMKLHFTVWAHELHSMIANAGSDHEQMARSTEGHSH